jgi:hypothetical protein
MGWESYAKGSQWYRLFRGGYTMKILWCWRCKLEIPMLDEAEFRQVGKFGKRIPGETLEEEFAPFLHEYERMTGFHETNFNAIYHHRLSLYGPPSQNCEKPLRSPKAKLCGACMAPVTD